MTTSTFQLSSDAEENYETFFSPLMAPFVEAAVINAELTQGASILDVACGTGFVARAAARAVGHRGRVAAVDIHRRRLDFARAVAEQVVPAIEWHEASVEQMPFHDGEFDAVVSQQGLQHFPSLARALAEMTRVCRSGGRIVATSWAPLERQGFFELLHEVGSRSFTAEAIERLRSAFGRVPPVAVIAELESHGVANIETDELVVWVTLPSADAFMPGLIAVLSFLGEEASNFPAEQFAALIDELASALKPYQAGPGMRVPLASWIVSGTR